MTIEIKNIDSLITNLDKFVQINNKALSRGINRGIVSGRKESVIDTRARWNIKSGEFKGDAYKIINKSSVQDPDSVVAIKTASIPLSKFVTGFQSAVTPTGKTRKDGSAFKYKLSKQSKGTKKLSTKKAFLMQSKRGTGLEVWTRRKNPNTGSPITIQYAITPTSMLGESGLTAFEHGFQQAFTKRYLHELTQLMK